LPPVAGSSKSGAGLSSIRRGESSACGIDQW
jgi:hypothetical protein